MFIRSTEKPESVEGNRCRFNSYVSTINFHRHIASVKHLEYRNYINSFRAVFEQHNVPASISQLKIYLLLATDESSEVIIAKEF